MATERLMLHDSVIPLEASLSAFLLDRKASQCTAKTLQHYLYACGGFRVPRGAGGQRHLPRIGVVVQCLPALRGFPCQGRLGAP